MKPQLTIFQEISCAHCGTVDSGSDGDKYAGFWDADTKQFCCKKCRNIHYCKKQGQNPTCKLSEMPVLHGMNIYN